MAKQKINAAQSPSINKKLDTTSSVITAPRIEVGVAGIVNGTSTTVTFSTSFNTIPIVFAVGTQGNGSSSAFAYPAASATAFNDRVFSVASQTTTNFVVNLSGSAVGVSSIAEFTWIAVGN